MYQKNSFWYRKFSCIGGEGGITVFSNFFCLTGPKNFVKGPVCVSEIFWYGKKLWIRDRLGGGGITFFRRIFFVSQCRKILWATLQCFRKFGVSKIFMHKKGISLFSVDFFCFTVPIKFVGEPLRVSKKFWYRKFLCIGGGHHGFVDFFSQDRNEKLPKGTLLFSRKFLVSKKFYG